MDAANDLPGSRSGPAVRGERILALRDMWDKEILSTSLRCVREVTMQEYSWRHLAGTHGAGSMFQRLAPLGQRGSV